MKRVGQQQRWDYALHRMGSAIDRLLGNESKQEKTQAVMWLAAWKAVHEELARMPPPVN